MEKGGREEERKRKNEKQNNLMQLKRVKLRQAGVRCPKLKRHYNAEV